MKIAFLGNLPASAVLPEDVIRPSHRGGNHPAPWIAALLPALAKLTDYKLRVFLPQRAVMKRIVVEKDGVEYEGLPVNFTERWNPQTFYAVKSIAAHRALKQYQPDLIHAFGFETGNATVALRTGLPVSCFIQGIIEHLYPYIGYTGRYRRQFQRVIERSAAEKVRWFVAETEFAADWARSHRQDAHVAVIPHPLRPSFLEQGTATGRNRIVSVGGLDARKGMETLIHALAEMSGKDTTLRIIGSGPDFDMLKRLASDLEVGDRVALLGSMPSEQVIQELKKASVFSIASRMDTSPNVISEAHAMGLPIVGTRVGGIPEMIDDGENGYLVDRDDHHMVARHLDYLCQNPEEAHRMGLHGRVKVAQLNDPDEVARAHVRFFEHIRSELGKD